MDSRKNIPSFCSVLSTWKRKASVPFRSFHLEKKGQCSIPLFPPGKERWCFVGSVVNTENNSGHCFRVHPRPSQWQVPQPAACVPAVHTPAAHTPSPKGMCTNQRVRPNSICSQAACAAAKQRCAPQRRTRAPQRRARRAPEQYVSEKQKACACA